MANYKRIMVKLSGEALKDRESDMVISPPIVEMLAEEIKSVHELGIEVCVVIGGGNIFRGAIAEGLGLDRVKGDYMGMMATVINSLALESAISNRGIDARVLSAIGAGHVVANFSQPKALEWLEQGKVVIFAGGTGNPYFTTDTAAALRAVETRCELLLKGTNVNGVYTDDPRKNPNAKKLDQISYRDALSQGLRVMDQTAFALCGDNNLPIIVFDISKPGNVKKAVLGEAVGTRVCN